MTKFSDSGTKEFKEGDKVRLFGYEVYKVVQVFINMTNGQLCYKIKRGCVTKFAPASCLVPFER